ncbi:MAG: ABC transporter ATP-binding protein [Verrucomicrobiae bacterium]|nr:ABC transporter ATP-binding protein [Verrucomicrobiae bacterium]
MEAARGSRWAVYGRALRYYRPHAGASAAAAAFVLLAIGANLLKPWPLKYIFDIVLGMTPSGAASPGYHDARTLLFWCVAIVGLHLAWGAFNLVNNYLLVRVGLQALARVRRDLFAHLHRLSLKFHDARSSADSMFRVSYDAQAIQSIFNRGFSSVFSIAVTFAGTVAVMAQMSGKLTLLALGIAPVLGLAIWFYADRIRRQSTTISESDSALSARVQEGLSGIRIIHAFGREEYELNRFEEQCLHSLRANLKLTFSHVSSALVVGTLMAAGTAAMAYAGACQVMRGALTPGELLVFISYLAMLYEPLQSLSYTAWALEGAAAGAQRVFEVLDTREDVADRPGAEKLASARGGVAFEGVCFGYDSARLILREVSLRVEEGRTAAFVGATGAGKTTLLSLVPRFYDPLAGAVRVGGRDVREVTKRSLRAQVGMVLQDTMLLAGTVRDNIRYGRLEATDVEVERAAKLAQVHDFAAVLPRGYDTEVGERGVRFSVGQRQRIGIARAFLKDAPILLLDEPTSALDPETEAAIMETLRELMAGRTTIVVTHRIATVHAFDRIFVLDSGRVAEEGPGAELLDRDGIYARLYRAQTKPSGRGKGEA